MADPFLKMLLTPTQVVLGKTLRPLSACHLAALALFKSPFWCGGNPGPTDLLTAVATCTESWRGGIQHILDIDSKAIEAWGASLKELDWDKEIVAFRDYLNWYLEDLPEIYHDKDAKLKPSGMPWPVQAVSAILIHMPGITEQEAWDMSVLRLACYRAAIAENNGYELVTEWQKEAAKKLAMMEKANG